MYRKVSWLRVWGPEVGLISACRAVVIILRAVLGVVVHVVVSSFVAIDCRCRPLVGAVFSIELCGLFLGGPSSPSALSRLREWLRTCPCWKITFEAFRASVGCFSGLDSCWIVFREDRF